MRNATDSWSMATSHTGSEARSIPSGRLPGSEEHLIAARHHLLDRILKRHHPDVCPHADRLQVTLHERCELPCSAGSPRQDERKRNWLRVLPQPVTLGIFPVITEAIEECPRTRGI